MNVDDVLPTDSDDEVEASGAASVDDALPPDVSSADEEHRDDDSDSGEDDWANVKLPSFGKLAGTRCTGMSSTPEFS
jgi:hypothetical protein